LRGEGKDKKQEQDSRVFLYKVCSSCRAKMHIFAKRCPQCSVPTNENILSSHNQEDMIYNTTVNSAEMCPQCDNAKLGNICEPIFCFGLGRENCEFCKGAENIRYICCQRVQKKSVGPTVDGLKELFSKNPEPIQNTLEDDVIPF